MILRMPSYYKEFKCKASECRDNCCIGNWDIDIDRKSLIKYEKIEGEFGERLKNNISYDEYPHFKLTKENRCPFLDENNLCDIYKHLGKDALCEICTNHPRYYYWYDGIKEGGIGLACEEAARIIINQTEPFSYYDIEIPVEINRSYKKETYDYLFQIRSKIIAHLQNDSIPFGIRLNDILWYAQNCQDKFDEDDLSIDEIPVLEKPPIKNCSFDIIMHDIQTYFHRYHDENLFEKYEFTDFPEDAFKGKSTKEFENIAVYFIWRHFLSSVNDDYFFYTKVSFAVLSTILIAFFSLHEKDKTIEELAIYYSKEIEYDTANLGFAFDFFDENFYFMVQKISPLTKIF